ncbi:MAG TPA: PAS domain S-box protein [Anaerolineae bacterium]|nr:PAS domain S-box protein [Anaerolineae bacterium]
MINRRPYIIIGTPEPARLPFLTTILDQENYQVKTVKDGVSALALALNKWTDLVILTPDLPKTSCFEICRKLQSYPRLYDIPVIIISQQFDAEEKAQAFESGAVDYFAEPYDLKALQTRIKTQLKLRALQRRVLRLEQAQAESQRLELAMYESKANYQSLFDNNHAMILLLDPETSRIVDANQVASDFYGYPVSELVGTTFIVSKQQQRADGQIREVEVFYGPITLGGQSLLYAIIHDVTERKQAEEKLQILSEAVKQSPYSILITDRNGKIQYANPAFSQLSGYSLEEIRNQTPHIFTTEFTSPELHEQMWQSVASGETFQGEFCHRRKDGDLYWVNSSMSPIRNGEGEVTHLLTIKQDNTQLKRLEQEKQQLEEIVHRAQRLETIGTLAGGIAHEFNNLLTPIVGHAELAMQEVPPESQTGDSMASILKAANRAKDLVLQMLAFSRKMDQQKEPIEIALLVTEALQLLRPSLPNIIDFKVQIDQNCAPVMADPTQIHQVLMNLCTNAFHAMEQQGGTLTIKLEKVRPDEVLLKELKPGLSGQYVKLTVADTGQGMDADTRARIFEPFFTTKEVGKGTGLGLAVVHGIVESHGGIVTVESIPNQGTTFEIFLPTIEQEARPVEQFTEPAKPGRERVLLVDDEEIVLDFLTTAITKLGYQVSPFASGQAALEAVQQNPERFDLVISDSTMPMVPGQQFSRKLHSLRQNLPLMLLSGDSFRLEEAGTDLPNVRAVLQKPISIRQLGQSIRSILDLPLLE